MIVAEYLGRNYFRMFTYLYLLQLVHLESEGHKMTLDWVSRTVYAVESNLSSAAVISYNLDEGEAYRIIERNVRIGDIVVDPYTRFDTFFCSLV